MFKLKDVDIIDINAKTEVERSVEWAGMSCEYENFDLEQGFSFSFSDGTEVTINSYSMDLDYSGDFSKEKEISLIEFITLMTDSAFKKEMESMSKDEFIERMKSIIKDN